MGPILVREGREKKGSGWEGERDGKCREGVERGDGKGEGREEWEGEGKGKGMEGKGKRRGKRKRRRGEVFRQIKNLRLQPCKWPPYCRSQQILEPPLKLVRDKTKHLN